MSRFTLKLQLGYKGKSKNKKQNKKKQNFVLGKIRKQWAFKHKQETLCVTIAMICSILALLWKSQYFQRPIYNLVEDLWWSLYCKDINPLSIFTKKLYCRCSHRFWIHLCFLKTFQTFCFFKGLFIIRLLKSVQS